VTAAAMTDDAAVQDIIDAYADRLRAADVAGVIDLFTADAAVMAPELPTTVGKDALEAVYRGALDGVAMDFAFEYDEIVVRGETAIARTRTSGVNTVRATGAEMPARYRELFVLEREQGGWKIAWYTFQPRPEQS
jgi:uncharacterized protein (TIGR02246 family)